MINKSNLVVRLLVPILTVHAVAQAQHTNSRDGVDGTISLGQHYAFILKEPRGWILDGSAGKSQGMEAVLYRDGSSWKDAIVVMYVRIVQKDARGQGTVDQIVQKDILAFKEVNKKSTVMSMADLATRDNKKAIVKGFYDAENKSHEAVAFIDEQKVVVIIAVSSRSQQEYASALPAFKQLLGTYFFVRELVDPK